MSKWTKELVAHFGSKKDPAMYPKEVAEQLKKDYIEGLCVMIVCTSVVCFFKMILRIFVLSALSGDVCMKIIKFFSLVVFVCARVDFVV